MIAAFVCAGLGAWLARLLWALVTEFGRHVHRSTGYTPYSPPAAPPRLVLPTADPYLADALREVDLLAPTPPL